MNQKQLTARWSGERGVTLVELVVVIAVAGILVAVSSPSVFGAIRRERQLQVVNDVANHYRKARNQAMARGEAVLVTATSDETGASGGNLRTYRLIAQVPGANPGDFVLGAPACNMDTEDRSSDPGTSTDDCPLGASCVQGPAGGGVCWGPGARSCRDLAVAGTVNTVEVESYDLDARSSSNLGMRYAYGSNNWVCFNPDGSAVSSSGAAHGVLDPSVSCDGDGFLVWMAKRDTAISWTSVKSSTRCGATADEYEVVNGYVIRVNNNGEIGLRSPR